MKELVNILVDELSFVSKITQIVAVFRTFTPPCLSPAQCSAEGERRVSGYVPEHAFVLRQFEKHERIRHVETEPVLKTLGILPYI